MVRSSIYPPQFKRGGFILIVVIIFLFMGLLGLDRFPSLWWDEGWTLSVARNWVELGHYGRLLNGDLNSSSLSGHFPVVASIALSFKVFGIGIWQGRLPGVLYMLGAILCLLYLAKEIYNPTVAIGSLFVLLLMTIAPEAHPILNGRQALGELPALFYLLGGYFFLTLAMRRSIFYLLPVVLFWGIAMRTKAQVQPFWVASVVVPLGVVLIKRWWREGVILLLAGIGAWLVEDWLGILQGYILAGHTVAGESIQGLYDVTAIVPYLGVRFRAVRAVLMTGFPTLAGLCYATWGTFRQVTKTERKDSGIIVQTAILALSLSWFCWYVLSANFWGRYLFPAVFIGSIFVAKMLYDLTGGFDVKKSVSNASSLLLGRARGLKSTGALFAILIITTAVALTVYFIIFEVKNNSGSAVEQVADYINTNTSKGALIETYDSELFFFLERAYHYPPDQISVELMRRHNIDPNTPVNYDPLQADPDYLIVGPFSRKWEVYNNVLDIGEFQRVKVIAPYEIFIRVRK